MMNQKSVHTPKISAHTDYKKLEGTLIVTIGKIMRFHQTLPFITKQRCSSAAATSTLHQKLGIIDTSVATSDIVTCHQM